MVTNGSASLSWMTTSKWRDERSTGIGATDVAAILGVHRWKSPLEVWAEKTGRIERSIEPPSERAHWGQVLEPVVVREYTAAREGYMITNGLVVVQGTSPGAALLARSEREPWMLCSPDAIVVPKMDAVALLDARMNLATGEDERGQSINMSSFPVLWGADAKTADAMRGDEFGEEGTDEIPPEYVVQCDWSMAVCGVDRWDVPVLIGGNRFAIYTVTRELAREQATIETVREWRDRYLIGGERPEPGPLESARKLIERMHPEDVGEMRMASPEEEAMIKRRLSLKLSIGSLEKELETIDNELRARIGDGEGIMSSFAKATWKRTKGSGIDYKRACEIVGVPQTVLDECKKAGYRRFLIAPLGGK